MASRFLRFLRPRHSGKRVRQRPNYAGLSMLSMGTVILVLAEVIPLKRARVGHGQNLIFAEEPR